jgi:hypothetical protein
LLGSQTWSVALRHVTSQKRKLKAGKHFTGASQEKSSVENSDP